MGEKPIIFSSEMVRAILDDRKTQTRRVIPPKLQLCKSPEDDPEDFVRWCKYGQPGDRLWVRETFSSFSQRHLKFHDNTYPVHTHCPHYPDVIAIYRESGADFPQHFYDDKMAAWEPSIHMPRWASRITLEIVSVRVQRVQDISEDDAEAESFLYFGETLTEPSPRDKFREYWDKLNAKRGYIWIANPWVWAIEFKRVEK